MFGSRSVGACARAPADARRVARTRPPRRANCPRMPALMRHLALALSIASAALGACSADKPADLPGLRGRRVRARRVGGGRPARAPARATRADDRGEGAAVQPRGRAGDRGQAAGRRAAQGLAGAAGRPAPGQAHARARRGPRAARAGERGRGAGRVAAQARRGAVRDRRHRARPARRFARQPRDQGGAGARARRPARGVAAAGARGADPRAGCPGGGGARGVEPVELAARPEADLGEPGRAGGRHPVPRGRMGAGGQPGGALAAAART